MSAPYFGIGLTASDDSVRSVILRSKYSQKPQVCGYLHVILLPFLTILDQLSSSHPMVSLFFCELLILLPRTGHEPTFHCLNDFNYSYIMTFCTRFVTTSAIVLFYFSEIEFPLIQFVCYAVLRYFIATRYKATFRSPWGSKKNVQV